MKILVCGDSWSEAWGVKQEYAWPNYLDYDVDNASVSGASNFDICNQFIENYNSLYDLTIIGWSGVTRFPRSGKNLNGQNYYSNEFSRVDKHTIKFFKNMSLNDILINWQEKIDVINQISKVPVIHFSVFGDIPIKNDNFIDISFLEFLANKQGMFFKYDIPIFEFDWLNEDNLKLTDSFGNKYFPKNWKRACVEREDVRPGKNFLPCGHPNKRGHRLWGQFIKEKINDIFS